MWTSTRTLSCRFLMHLHWVQKAHIEPCAHTDRDDCAEILNHLISSNQTMAWIVEVFYVLPGWSNGCARGRWPSWSSALWSQNMAMPLCIFFVSTTFKVHAPTEVRAHFKGGISDVELFQFFLDSDTDKWLQWFCHGPGKLEMEVLEGVV